MKKRFLLLLLLCCALLMSLGSCQDKTENTTATTPTTAPPTTTTATTTTTVPPTPTKTVSAWLRQSMDWGLTYRFTVKNGENEVSFAVKTENGTFTLAYPLSQDEFFFYQKDSLRSESHLFGGGTATGLRFTDEGKAELDAAIENWFVHILPTLDLQSDADHKADVSNFSFDNATTGGTALLIPYEDSYAIGGIVAEDKATQKTVAIEMAEDFLFPALPENETLSNEMSPLLSQLILLDSGFMKMEGEGELEISDGTAYLVSIENSGKAPAIEGGKWQIYATLATKDGSETTGLFYGDINGVTTLRLGDILISLPTDVFEDVIDQLISALLDGSADEGALLPQPTPLPELPNPTVSDQPTSPDTTNVYFDGEGNLYFTVILSGMGEVSGALSPTEDGLALLLAESSITYEETTLTFSGNYTLSNADSINYATVPNAPVEIELDVLEELMASLELLGEYDYYQVKGNLAISLALPLIGKVEMDDIDYALLTDKSALSLVLDIKYPAIMNNSMLFMPTLPSGALTLSVACKSQLYMDDINVYLTTEVSAKYMSGLSMKTATKTTSVKLSKTDALSNIDTVISYMLNIDMSQAILPSASGASALSAAKSGTAETNTTVYAENPFALSLKHGKTEGTYLLKCDIAGLKALATQWGQPLDIPAELDGATVEMSIDTDEMGIAKCTVSLILSSGLAVALNGNVTYPESLAEPIVPDGIAFDPAYEWLVLETE